LCGHEHDTELGGIELFVVVHFLPVIFESGSLLNAADCEHLFFKVDLFFDFYLEELIFLHIHISKDILVSIFQEIHFNTDHCLMKVSQIAIKRHKE
jgi:hypothetical protein